ncbi:hypothetical protein T265_00809 [Opisthorchis viverrini]|uniref:Uncharacterized protein n=1 Tax=Opisthorchis viverrini TaxID=6198 RepID=A0A075A4V1_OPIVI|nr:hypothetical protein T265_00809 [Opisthorchis viverrini]KER33312.1 hypothetical protein T265_00809 [Opisthorchis viverrini]
MTSQEGVVGAVHLPGWVPPFVKPLDAMDVSDGPPSFLQTQGHLAERNTEENSSAVAPFRCLTAVPSEGSTPSCPIPEKRSRDAEVGFEPRNFRQKDKRSAPAPFQCLAAMPPEESTRAGTLPGCPSLDRESREAEVGFEPRTFRSVNSRSNHLGHLAHICCKHTYP